VAELVGKRLAEHVKDHARLWDLLARADARRQQEGGWGGPHILAAWMRGAPEWFEPVLDEHWPSVPAGLRAQVLWAAQRAGLPTPTLEGPVVSGHALSASVQLARLLNAPVDADPQDVRDLLPALWDRLPHGRRAEALHRLAAHPHPMAQAAVLERLTSWMSYDDPPPDARDAVAIVGRMIEVWEGEPTAAGEGAASPGADLLQTLAVSHAPQERRPLYHAVFEEHGLALLRAAAGSRWSFDDSAAVEAFVAMYPRHADAWMDMLRGYAARDQYPPGVIVPATLPADVARDALLRIVSEAPNDDLEWFWAYAAEQIGGAVGGRHAAELVSGMDARQKRRVLCALRPSPERAYLAALGDALKDAADDDAEAIVQDVARLATAGINPDENATPVRDALAAEAARRVGSTAGGRLERIVGGIDSMREAMRKARERV
jgi:hypothetical protein